MENTHILVFKCRNRVKIRNYNMREICVLMHADVGNTHTSRGTSCEWSLLQHEFQLQSGVYQQVLEARLKDFSLEYKANKCGMGIVGAVE